MRKLILILTALISSQGFAHGEDRPGPHGGFITMPGAFHVEVVPVNKTKIMVYLLDIDWKNPTIRDSSVEVSRDSDSAKCRAKKDFFVCDFPSTVDLAKPGFLNLKATRDKQVGNAANYQLPLRLKKSQHH